MARILPEAKVTFTADQLSALKLACHQVNWKNSHSIDIRLSIPSYPRRFYVVFLAGRERRSAQRYSLGNSHKALATLTALIILSLGCTVIYGLLQLALAASQRDNIYPTAIPWLQTQDACEQTGRFWEEGRCWDAMQSPDF
ncbi:MAG: hypothetical protein KME15_22505 [Drouetiella hepatica Uher 2000/2452]|uniref:Uncharacterized protein n=1 Tax=Drouetiella hepatica Uher 2000/2452 TaxID=904376 RepID=A0A951QEW2_9CYAN|nr:hypothetical protein [Drouetiella hepatica Uher 2000/2452]